MNTPGQILWHPIALTAALVIVINDFYLKIHHPGWWSGKLSDFALCIFLPIWLFALISWTDWAHKRLHKKPWTPTPNPKPLALTCSLITATYFSALQLSPTFAHFHTWWLNQLIPTTQFTATPDPPFLLVAYHLMTTHHRQNH